MPEDQSSGLPLNPFRRILARFDPDLFYEPPLVQLLMEQVQSDPRRSSVLVGAPGYGKTSLLKFVESRAGSQDLYVYADCAAPPSDQADASQPFSPILRALIGALNRRLKPDAPQSAVDDGTPDPLRPALAAARNLVCTSSPPTSAISAIRSVAERLDTSGARLVLLLDDFDTLFGDMSTAAASSLIELLPVVSMVTATQEPLNEVNPAAYGGSPLFQMLTTTWLRGLRGSEAETLLKHATRHAHPLHPKDVEKIIEFAGGVPSLLVLAADAVWETYEELDYLAADPPTPLPAAQWQVLKAHLERIYEVTFRLYWHRLTTKTAAREAVIDLARGKRTVGATASQSSMISLLRDLGLLKPTRGTGRYALFSKLFADYVLRHADDKGPEAVPARTPADVVNTPAATLLPNLSTQEATMYTYLAAHPGRYSSNRDILGALASGDGAAGHNVHVIASRLRKKLRAHGQTLMNGRKLGYQLIDVSTGGAEARAS